MPEYLAANRRMLPAGAYEGFRQQVTALHDRTARIEVTPTWATVLDSRTRAPCTVMELAAAKGLVPE